MQIQLCTSTRWRGPVPFLDAVAADGLAAGHPGLCHHAADVGAVLLRRQARRRLQPRAQRRQPRRLRRHRHSGALVRRR